MNALTYIYKAKVIDVHDGDTLTAIFDLGLGVSKVEKIRLRGINAPELKTGDPGNAARDWLKAATLDKEVTLQTFKDRREKYGRYLANVYIQGDEKSLNEQMLTLKLAESMTV